MSDEPSYRASAALALRDVVDMLRDDAAAAELRSGKALEALEVRLMGAIGGVRGDLGKYIDTHAGDHQAMRTTSEIHFAKYDAYIAANAIDQARRDGALGIARYVIDLLGRNWQVVGLIVAGVAAATGAVHISIGGSIP